MTATAPESGPLEGRVLWTPSPEFMAQSNLAAYMLWLAETKGLRLADYAGLWRWSVEELEEFWQSLTEYFEIRFESPASRVLSDRSMPGARWFEGARLNYAEHVLRADGDATAIIARAEDGSRAELTFAELRRQVARARAGLMRLGVEPGDRVVGFLSNTPEAVISLLAASSLGAIWSSCPPEFGVGSVLDRFRQVEPKVLIGVDGYVYGGRTFDRREALGEIRASLPSLQATVVLQRGSVAEASVDGAIGWAELVSESAPLEFTPVDFEHPLWILYSSGTTGLPKAIVHGHGGILLEHFKQLSLQSDLKPQDPFFWYSTTGWMMWNYLVGGLLVGATIVLYDGSPAHPDLMALFRMADEEKLAYFGTSAPFLMACHKVGLAPGSELEFEALRAVGSTGAPLSPEGFEWVYENWKRDVWLGSISGGSDVCTGFVASSPLLPVRAGRIQCNCLGARVEAFDPAGQPLIGEVGELVVTEPLPSMPVFFWNDPDGSRLRESYFDDFEGVWRHGDWIEFDEDGSSVIFGRSDSTLNRGGVRMGTSEFYRVIEGIPEIADSLVVETGSLGREGKLWLFVVPAPGQDLDDGLTGRIRKTLRVELSPRHVPDEIRAIPQVPTTLSGKKLEVPIKRILTGTPLEQAVNPGTLSNPDSIQALLDAVGVLT